MTTACELLQKWRENGNRYLQTYSDGGKMATGACKLAQMAGKSRGSKGVKIKSNRGARILC